MLYASLLLSGLLLVVVNAVALRRDPRAVREATLLSFVAVFPLLCVQSVPLFFHAIALTLAGAACWALRARPRWFLLSSLAATAAAYGCAVGMFWAREGREWDRVKAAYPLESLAPRLAYEDRPGREGNAAASRADRVASLEKRFVEETDFRAELRERSLERMHAGFVRQFVDAQGFGVSRMPKPAPRFVEWSDPRDDFSPPGPVPQPSRPFFTPEPEPGTLRIGYDPGLGEAHETNVLNFLTPSDFGYARDREHVAGFRPHHFRQGADAPQRWKVERLELVGLLKYDDPVVYLSENLPAMDELRDAPARPLDAFESEALAGLRRGEDLMVQDRPDRLRALGSIRAVKQCLPCHHAERGELLGAFSYKLVREAVKD
jgi:hypothetical protein